MAKDGTNRGGARPGAGRKPKALSEKIAEGREAKVLACPDGPPAEDTPLVKDFLKAVQSGGPALTAEEIYRETFAWLQARGCAQLVTAQLVEQYAMSAARWVQCETLVSENGFLGEHPTTGASIASPYVAMSQAYLRQTNCCWAQIYQIVKENCSVEYAGPTSQGDMMERLLSSRKRA